MRKLTIEKMHKIDEDRNGKCLSEKYINNITKLKWMFSEGHIWEAIPDSVKRGTWCRACKGLNKLTIEEMQQIAEDRNGKCLSEKYINNSTKLKWICSEGHIWEAQPSNVKLGTWCKICSIK